MILTWGDATDYRIRDCRGRSQRERRLSPIESPDAISAQPLAISKLLALLILIALGLKDVLERLRTGVCSVTELAEPFRMAQPTISRHLKVLERAGLVARGRNAQWRPRALKAAPLREANVYLERFRALWDDRLDRMELYLKE